jgi:hypothetical protein
MNRRNWLLALVGPLSLLLSGCSGSGNISDAYTHNELQKLLANTGFTLLPVPDTKIKPGTVVAVTNDADGKPRLRYFGDFKSCNVPEAAFGLVSGSSPPVNFTKYLDLNIDLSVGFKGITIGPEYKHVKKVVLKVEKSGGDAIDLIKLNNYLSSPVAAARLTGWCKEHLSDPTLYVVSEAFRVRGRYDLYDSDGVKIALKGPVNPVVSVDASASGASIVEGGISYDQDYYIAVHDVKSAAGTMMGGPSSPTLDARLAAGFSYDPGR